MTSYTNTGVYELLNELLEPLGLLMGYGIIATNRIGFYWWEYTGCYMSFPSLFAYDYPQTDEVYETV
jgi:hypothetical protein